MTRSNTNRGVKTAVKTKLFANPVERIRLIPTRLMCGMTDWFERVDEPHDPVLQEGAGEV